MDVIKMTNKFRINHSYHFRGKVVMPLRMAKPWLLLDWIYKLTKTATDELDQKSKLNEFTMQVRK